MYYYGENKVWCRGKLILGPNPKAVLFTFILINTPVLTFTGFVFKFYWERSLEWQIALCVLWYLLAATNFFMVHAASREPGIVPHRYWNSIKG